MLKRITRFRYFLASQKRIDYQEQIDRRLVYALAPRKIPTGRQLKHLKKFLNPREHLIVKVCSLLIVASLVYLGVNFIKKHIQYQPVFGGEYVEGAVGYPKSINPLYAPSRDIDGDLSNLIYSSLFKYDTSGNLVNDLASSLNINGNTEYFVKIKDNARWHNGEALTADDVIFTINLIKNADYRSPLQPGLADVAVEKVDQQTIKFILPEPYAPFPEMLTFGILPKSIWENIGPDAAALSDLNLKPIGSGPYKFKSLLKNKDGEIKEYRLEANPDYYGQPPYLKNITFKFYINYQEAIRDLNNNQIDGLSYLPFEERANLLGADSLWFHELVRPQVVSIFFNREKNKSLADKATRIALAQAIDKSQIINDVFDGVYQPADGPILSSSFAYSPNLTKYTYVPETKIASATLSLTVIDSGSNLAVAEAVKKYWETAGVIVELKAISREQSLETVKNRDFEALLYGESTGGDPDVYAFWHSSQNTARGLNLAGYSNPEVDKLLIEARQTANREERVAKYQKFQEILTNDAPAIFLYSPVYTYLQSKKIKGFSGTVIINPADRFSDVSNWYIKTKKKLGR